MGRVVAGKLHPLLQTQTVVGRHIPGLPDPLEITGKTFRRPGETVILVMNIIYLSTSPECAELVVTVSQAAQYEGLALSDSDLASASHTEAQDGPQHEEDRQDCRLTVHGVPALSVSD